MKRSILFLLIVTACTAPVIVNGQTNAASTPPSSDAAPKSAAPVPILLYDFDQAQDDTVTSKGSAALPATLKPSKTTPAPLLSKDGEGVTGKPGDFALDLRGATGMGKNGEGGVAIVTHPPLDGLKSFTVTGWFKCATAPAGGARLFDYAGEKAGFLVGLGDGKWGIQVNGRGWNTNTLPSPTVGMWMFFAITYDSTKAQDNLVFYEAVAGDAVNSETLTAPNPEALAPNSNGILAIGNWPSGQRPLQGLLDDMAIYGSTSDGSGALTSDQVNALFTAAGAVR